MDSEVVGRRKYREIHNLLLCYPKDDQVAYLSATSLLYCFTAIREGGIYFMSALSLLLHFYLNSLFTMKFNSDNL